MKKGVYNDGDDNEKKREKKRKSKKGDYDDGNDEYKEGMRWKVKKRG